MGAESVESVAKIKGYDEPKSTEVHYSEDETEAKQTDNDDPENTSHGYCLCQCFSRLINIRVKKFILFNFFCRFKN